MASGFQATPGQFLEGVVATPPWELIKSAMAQKQQDFDTAMATTDILRQNLLINHLPTEEAAAAASMVKDGFNSDIDKLVNKMYKDPNSNYLKDLKALQSKLVTSRQPGGDIYKLERPVKYLQEKKDSDAWKEAAKKGYSSYGDASRWYMTQMAGKSGLEQDFDIPTLDDVLHEDYDFQKLAKNAKDILEASKKSFKRDTASGLIILTNGMRVEELTYEKVLGSLVSQLRSDGKFNSWASQKDKHSFGQTSYSNTRDWFTQVEKRDAEGNVIIDEKTGQPVLETVANTSNSLMGTLDGLSRSMAYSDVEQTQSISPHTANIAAMNEAGRNNRFNIDQQTKERHFIMNYNKTTADTALGILKEIRDPDATPEQKIAAIKALHTYTSTVNPRLAGFNDLTGGFGAEGTGLDGRVTLDSTPFGNIEAITGSGSLNNESKVNMIQEGLQKSFGVTVENHPYMRQLAEKIVNSGNSSPADVRAIIEGDIMLAIKRRNPNSIPSVFRPIYDEYRKAEAVAGQANNKLNNGVSKNKNFWEADSFLEGVGMFFGANGAGASSDINLQSKVNTRDAELRLPKEVITKGLDNIMNHSYGSKGQTAFSNLYPGGIPNASQTYNFSSGTGATLTKQMKDKNIASQYDIFIDGINVNDQFLKGDPSMALKGDMRLTDNLNSGVSLVSTTTSGKNVVFKPRPDSEHMQTIVYNELLKPGAALGNTSIAQAYYTAGANYTKEILNNLLNTGGSTNFAQTVSAEKLLPKGYTLPKGYQVNISGDNTNGRRYNMIDDKGYQIFEGGPINDTDLFIQTLLNTANHK